MGDSLVGYDTSPSVMHCADHKDEIAEESNIFRVHLPDLSTTNAKPGSKPGFASLKLANETGRREISHPFAPLQQCSASVSRDVPVILENMHRRRQLNAAYAPLPDAGTS
jgi:hypothetical protein